MNQQETLKIITENEGIFQNKIPNSSHSCLALEKKKEIIRIPASSGRSSTWRLFINNNKKSTTEEQKYDKPLR